MANSYDEPSPQAFGSPLERYRKRLSMLNLERSTWLYHWQELNDYIFPRRFRYLQYDRNKGTKKNDKIINNKATVAVRTLASGMMAGITSPARTWFKLLGPARVRDDADVKMWLAQVEKITREELIKSNCYNVLHELYITLAVFGSPAMYVEETPDSEDLFRAYLFPMGQYSLAASAKNKIDTIYRQFNMTVAQLIEEFGLEKCSTNVKNMYIEGAYDSWVRVVHVIEPNKKWVGQKDAKNKKYVSKWFEDEANEDKFLRESGYDEFPVMAPRWSVTGEDVYGSCPGMEALGDVKALQLLERRSQQAVDKVVNPPMKGPMSLKSSRISLLPGDITYVPDNVNGQKLEPAIEVKPDAINQAQGKIQACEYRIMQTFYTDLFRKMESADNAPNGGKQPVTAREINERHEEALLELGPVLERIHDELLNPFLNRVIQILWRAGRLPPLPAKLKGANIRVEYVSIMAQAQKILGTASIERFSSFVGSLSAVNKDILDLVNFDAMIREYAESLGVPIELLNKDEVVEQMRQARQQAQAQQAQMDQATQGAEAAKAAAGAQITPDNLLGRLMGGVGQASA
jgi:hypothetical protein